MKKRGISLPSPGRGRRSPNRLDGFGVLARPAALALLLVGAGCRGGEANARAAEAVRLTDAIALLRDAPNPEKARFWRRLVDTPCTEPDLCRLRALCIGAYERHLGALDQTHAVQEALAADAAETRPRSLASAELELRMAYEQATECAREEAEIRKKYRL